LKVILLFTALLCLNFIAACGGGGSSGGSSDESGAGAGSATVSGVSKGQIQGFGSIIINDSKLETEDTLVEKEGVTAKLRDLQEGMVITVEGDFNRSGNGGLASFISFDDNLEGPITSINETTPGLVKVLTILGQTVIVESGFTRFDNDDPLFNFVTMAVGNVVEISGFINPGGYLQASFIERKAVDPAAFLAIAGNEFEIEGTVANLTATSFMIGNLTIDYSGVTPRNGNLANDRLVEVKGRNLAGNTLTATDVEIKGVAFDDNVAKAEVEGFVSDLDPTNTSFKIDGQAVNYAGADFIGGVEGDLAEGIKVEAQGPISSGVLNAQKVVLKASVKIESNADSIDIAAGTVTLEVLGGITVIVDDNFTELKDINSLADVNPGNNLKIRGRVSGSDPSITNIVATRFELESIDPDDRVILQGTIESFNANTGIVVVLGIIIDTTTIDNDDFKDDDIIIGRSEFFNLLAFGNRKLVKARLDLNDNEWDQIEFED